jgi:4'-phosphopantetheinyl transferase
MSTPPLMPCDFAATARAALVAAGLRPPRTDEVRLVIVDTADWQAWLPMASGLLQPSERERAARFRFEPDRASYVLAHALWRIALGYCLGVDTAAVPLHSTPAGQPCLPGTPLATSLSHSGTLVLIGVGHVTALGVDIERSPPRTALAPLMPTLCTPGEAVLMRALPAAALEAALLQLWTRKEALLKAFGIGLAQEPAAITVPSGGLVAAPAGVAAPACQAHDLRLPAGCVGAWAAPAQAGLGGLHVLS